MADQAMVGIGIIVRDLTDIPEKFRMGVTVTDDGGNVLTEDDGFAYYQALSRLEICATTDCYLSRTDAEGNEVKHQVFLALEQDLDAEMCLGGDEGTFFGVTLNSRYFPGFLDCDYPNGNGWLLPVDLDELQVHLSKIREILPDARVIVFMRSY
jgi:hypothetical protein